MFEPAVRQPTEPLNAAPGHPGSGRIGPDSGRRYTADDFRALLARMSRGRAARPMRARLAAAEIVVPEFVAWRAWEAPRRGAVQGTQRVDFTSALPRASEGQEGLETARGFQLARESGQGSGSVRSHPVPDAQESLVSDAEEEAGPPEAVAEAGPIPDPLPHEGGPGSGDVRADPAPGPPADAGPAIIDAEAPVADGTGDEASESELQSAETARKLLDIMAMPTGVQPQERALAGDTLLRLVPRMPAASLIALCDRLCIMDAPPPLLVRLLINHDNPDVALPLLERCPGIGEQELMSMIGKGDGLILRQIARRRLLSATLTDALIRHGDASVTIAVVRNPGAALSHEAFNMLAEAAKSRSALQAPLATRPDTPAPIAFELFWTLPPQLRRYVLSRFLTESANLDRILKIAQTVDGPTGGDGNGSPRIAEKAECEELVDLIALGKTTEAAQKLAELAGIRQANAERIIADSEGEPLIVAMKAIGMSRTQAAAAAETLRDSPQAPLRSNRRIAELQNLFDSLSFTKARVLLTYWDWAVEQSGPYSRTAP